MARTLIDAMERGRTVAWIGIEMNGAGSGLWDVAINVPAIIALVRHPDATSVEPTIERGLRVVASASR